MTSSKTVPDRCAPPSLYSSHLQFAISYKLFPQPSIEGCALKPSSKDTRKPESSPWTDKFLRFILPVLYLWGPNPYVTQVPTLHASTWLAARRQDAIFLQHSPAPQSAVLWAHSRLEPTMLAKCTIHILVVDSSMLRPCKLIHHATPQIENWRAPRKRSATSVLACHRG